MRPDPRWSGRPGVTLARAVLRWASRLVPWRRRRDWRDEWEGELWALDAGGASWWRLVRFALGGMAHAGSERREEEGMMMDGIVQDLRLAARRIARAPGFAVVTVSVLALGIGANTALFGALEAALLSSPPYPEADRIVLVDLLLEERAGAPPRLQVLGDRRLRTPLLA